MSIKKANKKDLTKKIIERAMQLNLIVSCKKLKIDNLILPPAEAFGNVLSKIYRQCIRTKEQPDGLIYDESTYRVILRILNGHLYDYQQMTDSYCWKRSKVESLANASIPIGCHSAEALLNLTNYVKTISDEKDQYDFLEIFIKFPQDLLLTTSPEEKRRCILVTEELYNEGLTYVIDEWMTPDSNGLCDVTFLHIGDVLIVTKDGLYRIGHDEFYTTHELI